MARIPKLDAAGKFLAADVNAQIDARTKATMRADLPALAKELKIGGVDGSVPIFPTLAEATAWEAANPGKKALTLEPSTPDTKAPTPGVLSVTPAHNSAQLSVSGATDDRAVTGYAFQVGASGGWSVWQSSPSFTATGLTASTSYAFRHKVRDAAGNEALGAAVTVSTTAAPPLQPGDVITSDAYTLYADGTVLGGKFTDATLGGKALQYEADGTAQVSGGNGITPAKGNGLSLWVDRQDRELSLTVRATSADETWMVVRADSSTRIILALRNNGVIGTVLQGPAGAIFGPGLPSGSYKVGDRIAIGATGNTGYVSINGVRKLELPDLRGNTFPRCGVMNAGAGFAWDDLVVKAL